MSMSDSAALTAYEMPREIFVGREEGPQETYRYGLFFVRAVNPETPEDDSDECLEGDVFTFTGPTLITRAKLVSHLHDSLMEQDSDEFMAIKNKSAMWDAFNAAAKLIMDGDLDNMPERGVEIQFECEVDSVGNPNEIWAYRVYKYV